jgi:hypothetical protein
MNTDLEEIFQNLPYLPTSNLLTQLTEDEVNEDVLNEIIRRIYYNIRLSTLANIDYLRNNYFSDNN